MSQTLAHRRILSAHARAQQSSDPVAAPPRAEPAPGGRPADWGGFEPASSAAVRALQTLVHAGARIVRIEPHRIVLRRLESLCEIDPLGRVHWRSK